jgi:DNA polymerase III subunit alpha
VAQRLEGFARNSSVHAAGVVISPEPLKQLVPLYRTNREEIVTQYDMNGLDKLRFSRWISSGSPRSRSSTTRSR